jgi:hypothetical protein
MVEVYSNLYECSVKSINHFENDQKMTLNKKIEKNKIILLFFCCINRLQIKINR